MAGAWRQIAFAVINEVITKMHLSQGRGGRLEVERPEKCRALGRHLETGPWLHPREA